MIRRKPLAKRLWSGFGQSGKDAAARRRRLRVEALEDRRLLALDFGDAPVPYPVSIGNDGARHQIEQRWDFQSELLLGGSEFVDSHNLGAYAGRKISLDGTGNKLVVDAFTHHSSNQQLRIYELNDLSRQWDLKQKVPHDFSYIESMEMSDDGTRFAIASYNYETSPTSRNVQVFELGVQGFTQIGQPLSLASNHVVTLGADADVVVTSLHNTEETAKIFDWNGSTWSQRGLQIDPPGGTVHNVAVSDSGSRVAILHQTSNGTSCTVYNWNSVELAWEVIGDSFRTEWPLTMFRNGERIIAQGYYDSDLRQMVNETSIFSLASDGRWKPMQYEPGSLPSDLTEAKTSSSGDIIAWLYNGNSGISSFDGIQWTTQVSLGQLARVGAVEAIDVSSDGSKLVMSNPNIEGDYPSEGVVALLGRQPKLSLGKSLLEDEIGQNSSYANLSLDDDGVVSARHLVGGNDAAIVLEVNGQNGFVDAWIDFNQDGNWYGFGEQILKSSPVRDGRNEFTIPIPEDAVPGATYARIRISETGGLFPTGYADSGEVEDHEFVVSSIPLPDNRDLELTLNLAEDALVLAENSSASEIVRFRRSILPPSISLFGNQSHQTDLHLGSLIDRNSNDSAGFQALAFTGGTTLGDSVSIESDPNLWAWLSSPAANQESLVIDLKEGGQTLNRYEFQSVETINIGEVDRVAFSNDQFDIGTTVYDLSPSKPVNLPLDTSIAGGTFRSTSTLGLHTAESLVGFGTIDAGFAGGRGSLLRLSGEMTIGDSTSSAGFNTDGLVEVGGNSLNIKDANQATLGELTTLGDAAQPGAITAANGLYLDFTGNIEGYGTIETVNGDATNIFLNNGTLSGNSSEQPLYVNSLIKGVGTLNNVVIQGTFSPGFSPTLSINGVVTYANQSNIEIELGGLLRGSQYDRIEHELAALAGQLDVKLIDGFLPMPGDLFEVIASAQPFVGSLNSVQMPVFENGIRLLERIGDSNIDLSTVFDVKDQLTVSDSEPGVFKIIDWNGDKLNINGGRFQAFVSPLNQFSASSVWWIDEVLSTDEGWTQIATDGTHSIEVEGSGWKNFVSPHDINNDGKTSVLDALMIINELSRGSFVDLDTNQLTPPSELSEWPGVFYDTNGDYLGTALDALLVINELARLGNSSGEGEILPLDQLFVYRTGKTISPVEWLDASETLSMDMNAVSDFGSGEQVSVGDSDNWYSGDLAFEYVGKQQSDAVDQLLSDESDWLN